MSDGPSSLLACSAVRACLVFILLLHPVRHSLDHQLTNKPANNPLTHPPTKPKIRSIPLPACLAAGVSCGHQDVPRDVCKNESYVKVTRALLDNYLPNATATIKQ